MANANDIANAVASYFKGDSTPPAEAAVHTPPPAPSGAGTAATANEHFHKDLDQSICPDCHDKVKKVMGLDPEKQAAVAGSMSKAFGN